MVKRFGANADLLEKVKILSDLSSEAPKSPSIDPAEVEKFSSIASEWWDTKGKFRPLHKFNPVRLGFIRETLVSHFGLDPKAQKPLSGLRLLDTGCGGGLVSEPMSRLGANVIGVDASEKNIKTAIVHAGQGGLAIDYRAGTVEGLAEAGEPPFDIVLNLEVVEHVANAAAFLETCANLVRPGGIMMVATINRTAKARALALFAAERILRWLPAGTHDYDKLVSPDEIREAVSRAGLVTDPPQGVSYNPLSDRWSLGSDTDMNYMMVCRRPA